MRLNRASHRKSVLPSSPSRGPAGTLGDDYDDQSFLRSRALRGAEEHDEEADEEADNPVEDSSQAPRVVRTSVSAVAGRRRQLAPSLGWHYFMIMLTNKWTQNLLEQPPDSLAPGRRQGRRGGSAAASAP